MRILVDMDGVLADWERAFLEAFRAEFPTEPFVALEQRRGFYAAEQYPEHIRDACHAIYHRAGFYRSLAPIPGGIEVMKRWKREGRDVWICSSPLAKYHHCVLEKYEWVEAYLGLEWVDRLILTRDKTLVRGGVLIDDNPNVKGIETPAWEHVVYDQPYNRDAQNKRRMTWETSTSIIL